MFFLAGLFMCVFFVLAGQVLAFGTTDSVAFCVAILRILTQNSVCMVGRRLLFQNNHFSSFSTQPNKLWWNKIMSFLLQIVINPFNMFFVILFSAFVNLLGILINSTTFFFVLAAHRRFFMQTIYTSHLDIFPIVDICFSLHSTFMVGEMGWRWRLVEGQGALNRRDMPPALAVTPQFLPGQAWTYASWDSYHSPPQTGRDVTGRPNSLVPCFLVNKPWLCYCNSTWGYSPNRWLPGTAPELCSNCPLPAVPYPGCALDPIPWH